MVVPEVVDTAGVAAELLPTVATIQMPAEFIEEAIILTKLNTSRRHLSTNILAHHILAMAIHVNHGIPSALQNTNSTSGLQLASLLELELLS